MSNIIKHYFACSNSSKGFQNLFASNINSLDKLYILKGGPGTGKSSLMKKVGTYFESKDLDIEYIHCSSDPDSLDGVIIRNLSIGIVDGTAPHVIEPKAPGAIEEYINLGAAWNIPMLTHHKKEILYLQAEISKCYPQAYDAFKKGLAIHDEWESIYISNMDFTKTNVFTENIIKELLDGRSINKKSTVMHRFFGSSTAKGSVDFVEMLTSPLETRYFIKGRPGSGKSTMLKKILLAAEAKGFDAEVYHCSFDPDSLDMVLLPELSLCIFDSTAPHEYFPNRKTDHVLDMYKELITPHTDEDYRDELLDITKRYKACINTGISYLAYAKTLHDELEKYYIEATDFSVLDQIYDNLISTISKLPLPHKDF